MDGNITVTCGANSQEAQLTGRNVADARRALAEALNIPKDANANVGGQTVKDSYVLKAGDTLEFIKPAGEKG